MEKKYWILYKFYYTCIIRLDPKPCLEQIIDILSIYKYIYNIQYRLSENSNSYEHDECSHSYRKEQLWKPCYTDFFLYSMMCHLGNRSLITDEKNRLLSLRQSDKWQSVLTNILFRLSCLD